MQDLAIPEPHDRETLRLEPCVTSNVMTILGMLRAVAFDDEPMFEADKIDDVGGRGGHDDATSSIAAFDPARGAIRRVQRPFHERASCERALWRPEE
jgi:hypothetical protein